MKKLLVAIIAGLTALAISNSAQAASIITFFGEDTETSAVPNLSAQAEQDFLASLSSYGTDGFENLANDTSSPMNLAFAGASVTGVLNSTASLVSRNSGYATYGSRSLWTFESVSLDFSGAISGFGFYIRDTATNFNDTNLTATVNFLNDESTTVDIPHLYSNDANSLSLLYFGLASDTAFDSITINHNNNYDVLLFDHMTAGYAKPFSAAPVPEPSSILLGALGLSGALGLRRKKKN